MSEKQISSVEKLLGVSAEEVRDAVEKWADYPDLPISMQTQDEMIRRGASGYLSKAWERYIDVKKIDGREPTPAASDDLGYAKGRVIKVPVEVTYDAAEDKYYLYAGNHRITQTEINGDPFIRAWVQPDKGRIGADASCSIRAFLAKISVKDPTRDVQFR